MRNAILGMVLIGAIGLCTAPCRAADVTLRKISVEEMKSACAKVGGKFSQDAGGYDCGTDCHGAPGTDCIVGCKGDQKCVAQVPGARRPRDIESALRAPPGTPR